MKAATRFADNTANKVIDRRRVYGYAPGLRMTMNPRGSNVPGWSIPQGQLILFKPRVDGYMKEKMKSVIGKNGERLLSYDAEEEYSAMHFANAVAAKFQGGTMDFGFRILECLTDLPYDKQTGEDEADDYFALLHPKLTCEMGLEEVTYGPAGDLLNGGLPLPCPTCRLKWLESTDCQEAIFNSRLDHNILEDLRKVLISSNKAGIIYATQKLAKSAGEVEATSGGNRKQAYDDADRHFMKLLHKKEKHVEQAEIQANAARIQGEAIGASVAQAIQAQADQAELERLRAEIAELKANKEAKKEAPKEKKNV